MTTRLALDRLTSAQCRRETYVGPWLPEPVVVAPTPEEPAEMAESLAIGFLAILEKLDPVSRAVFVLANVFGLPFDEVAAIVDRTPASTRQLAVRARRKVRAARPRPPSPAAQPIVDRLLAAVLNGDMAATMALLADDVVLVSDGGPNRRAARAPIVGPQRVSRFIANLARRSSPATNYQPARFNGSPGLWLQDPTYGDTAVCLDVTGDRGPAHLDRVRPREAAGADGGPAAVAPETPPLSDPADPLRRHGMSVLRRRPGLRPERADDCAVDGHAAGTEVPVAPQPRSIEQP